LFRHLLTKQSEQRGEIAEKIVGKVIASEASASRICG
jgi:hypothetical protein